jgi:hypothetical protein
MYAYQVLYGMCARCCMSTVAAVGLAAGVGDVAAIV